MNTDLESILEADEEARARLESFEKRAAARLEEIRRDAEGRRTEGLERSRRALEAEVRQILAEADREAAQRRARRSAYLADKDAHAQAALARAAEIFARILADGPPAGTVS